MAMADHDALQIFRDTAQLIAESVVKVVGFEEATIGMLIEPGAFEYIALAGNEESREKLLGVKTPTARLERELENSDEWGLLRFVPAERAPQDVRDNPDPLMVPHTKVIDHPDAWQPLDLLFAPLIDDNGTMIGHLSMDVPTDGMRPDAAKREALQKYAAQAGRAAVSAFQRRRAAHIVGLAEAVKDVVRRASTQASLAGIFRECEAALIAGFHARGMWLQTFSTERPDGSGDIAQIFATDGSERNIPIDLQELAHTAAHYCWDTQQSVVVGVQRPRPDMLSAEQHRRCLQVMQSIGVNSILFTPLGLGSSVLGNLVLARAVGTDTDWSDDERDAVFGLSEALGQAIVTTRAAERGRELIAELRSLDSYRAQLVDQLVAGLTHPLGRIESSLLVLESRPDLEPAMQTALGAIQRGVHRMTRVVDDLRILSRMDDPDHPVQTTVVDFGAIVDDVIDLIDVTAHQRNVTVTVDRPDTPSLVRGSAGELDRVVANIVSNAVKYTAPGGAVGVAHGREGDEIVLRVTDNGLGISPEDQSELFTEFFRSANPEALRRPGSGLGLAIVARALARHGGRVDVESTLGEGSTFVVRLPVAGELS